MLLSCNNKKDVVTLHLNNDTIYYGAVRDSSFYQEWNRSYKDEQHKKKSFNVISYTITNPTDKRLLFLIKDIDLINVYALETIVKKNGVEQILEMPLYDFSLSVIDSCSFCKSDLLFEQELAESAKLRLMGAKRNLFLFKSYLTQSVILEPNETREFKAFISLPFMRESDPSTLQTHLSYDLRPNNKYKYSLHYKLKKEEVLEELTPQQIDELKRNKIEIFDGELISNEVDLLPKF